MHDTQLPFIFVYCKTDCAELKATTTTELATLINRLERVCERLERVVSIRNLDIVNDRSNLVHATSADSKRNSDEIDNLPLPSLPTTPGSTIVNDSSSTTLGPTPPPLAASASIDDLDLNIPTVIQQIENTIFLNEQSPADYTPPKTMSVYGFQDIVNGSFAQFLALSAKIGGDVAKQADFVKKAFE